MTQLDKDKNAYVILEHSLKIMHRALQKVSGGWWITPKIYFSALGQSFGFSLTQSERTMNKKIYIIN